MPKRFELAADERLLSTHDISLVDGREVIAAKLHLTTQRLVVVTGAKIPSGVLFWLGAPLLFGLRALAADRGTRITHQIRREEFGTVEPGDRGMCVFHDVNEGYAHVSFAITNDILLTSRDSVQTWQQRMHQWASGAASAAQLPTARVIDD